MGKRQPTDRAIAARELKKIAAKAIDEALRDGERRGYSGEWRRMSADEHDEHAAAHILNVKIERDAARENHRAHALCREAMAIYQDVAGVAKYRRHQK